jgi:[protein-PII] uridylyltransferase
MNHLRMSATAQKQDLSDQDVIAAFAADVPDERHLTALYLLTVADVRGTSPKVWNAWKGKLLEDLYHATLHYLSYGKIADQIGETQREAAATLNLYAIAPETYLPLWAKLDDEYFIRHEAHEIAWHTRALTQRPDIKTPIIKTRLSRIGEGMQVLVYQHDQPYLFARICNFFARMNYNIMEAKVHTTEHGYALDSFLVMDASQDKTAYRDVMNYVEYALAEEIGGDAVSIPEPAFGRRSRQLKHFPIAPQVDLRRDEKGRYNLSLVAGDRPGLLARIAYILTRHKVLIRSAKINTLGARAEDTFWIDGEALNDANTRNTLREVLISQLS